LLAKTALCLPEPGLPTSSVVAIAEKQAGLRRGLQVKFGTPQAAALRQQFRSLVGSLLAKTALCLQSKLRV
jgi:hypothetical protein